LSSASELLMAKIDLAQGSLSSALRISLEVMRRDPRNVEAVTIRAEALFLAGDCEQAVQHVKEALRLDPDHHHARSLFKRAKLAASALSSSASAVKKRDFHAAIQDLSDLLHGASPPLNSPLRARALSERGSAWLQLKDYDKAIADANASLAIQDELRSARLTRDKALIALGELDQAIAGLQRTLDDDGKEDEVVQYWLDKARFEKRRLARPDYYRALNVSALALEGEVRSAYRTATLTCHPDRVAGKSEEERAAAAAHFNVVSDALDILTDPLKRQLYDEGHDKEAIAERVEAANRAAREERRHHHRE